MSLTNVEKFLGAVLAPIQDVEDALQQLKTGRSIDTAVGAQLDAIGKLVGQSRDGVTDDEIYRRYIRARISTNKSDGLIEDILTIADLIVYDDDAEYLIINQGAAAFVLRLGGIVPSDELVELLISFLRRGAAGGVRVILEYYSSPIADIMYWNGPGTWGSNWAAATD